MQPSPIRRPVAARPRTYRRVEISFLRTADPQGSFDPADAS